MLFELHTSRFDLLYQLVLNWCNHKWQMERRDIWPRFEPTGFSLSPANAYVDRFGRQKRFTGTGGTQHENVTLFQFEIEFFIVDHLAAMSTVLLLTVKWTC